MSLAENNTPDLMQAPALHDDAGCGVTMQEILGRAEQGMTRPFICRGDDGITYYVKGAHAGRRSLCCEWVAHRLLSSIIADETLGLPEFKMAEVPSALIRGSVRQDIRELGEGRVFASRRIEGGQELNWSAAQGWPDDAVALLLLVDLWVQNEDRSLSALGGNPNLLVTKSPAQPRLWAYDFNLAFDQEFNRARFFDVHVSGHSLGKWPQGFRERMEPLLFDSLGTLDSIFDELPLDWLHVDGDETLPVQLDLGKVRSTLELPLRDPGFFWRLS
jgi:hypothetical protein